MLYNSHESEYKINSALVCCTRETSGSIPNKTKIFSYTHSPLRREQQLTESIVAKNTSLNKNFVVRNRRKTAGTNYVRLACAS